MVGHRLAVRRRIFDSRTGHRCVKTASFWQVSHTMLHLSPISIHDNRYGTGLSGKLNSHSTLRTGPVSVNVQLRMVSIAEGY